MKAYTAAITLGCLLMPLTAAAAPQAASVTSPPLVVAGLLLGIVLLAVFVGLLVRTFRNMRAAGLESELARAHRHSAKWLLQWREAADPEAVRALIDELCMTDDTQTRQVYVDALAEITQRYFGADDVAWEVWWRRHGVEFAAEVRRQRANGPPTGEFLPVN